jgi:cell division protein FtsQ
MPVTAPADKRFRRAHMKPARRRSGWQSWRWRLALTLTAAALTFYTANRLVTIIEGLDVFHVDRIEVRGNQRLSNGEVLALLQGLRGQSILSVDLEEWRRALLRSPWVADAILRRTLPSTVEVTIQERSALGIGRIGGVLYLVDDRGSIIDEYGPSYADLDMPIIDGLSSLPGEEMTDVYRAMLVRRLLDALRVRRMASRISQIDVSDFRNAVVLLEGDPTLIRLGGERFVERLQSYLELSPALRERVPDIDYVDLRFDERVYVRPARKRPAPRTRPEAARSGRGTQTG